MQFVLWCLERADGKCVIRCAERVPCHFRPSRRSSLHVGGREFHQHCMTRAERDGLGGVKAPSIRVALSIGAKLLLFWTVHTEKLPITRVN